MIEARGHRAGLDPGPGRSAKYELYSAWKAFPRLRKMLVARNARRLLRELMELILWRHADAEDGIQDAGRKLTAKGRSRAECMAAWLRQDWRRTRSC